MEDQKTNRGEAAIDPPTGMDPCLRETERPEGAVVTGPRVFRSSLASALRSRCRSRATQALIPLHQNYRTVNPPRKSDSASGVVILAQGRLWRR
jgi:hypothetical protein